MAGKLAPLPYGPPTAFAAILWITSTICAKQMCVVGLASHRGPSSRGARDTQVPIYISMRRNLAHSATSWLSCPNVHSGFQNEDRHSRAGVLLAGRGYCHISSTTANDFKNYSKGWAEPNISTVSRHLSSSAVEVLQWISIGLLVSKGAVVYRPVHQQFLAGRNRAYRPRCVEIPDQTLISTARRSCRYTGTVVCKELAK